MGIVGKIVAAVTGKTAAGMDEWNPWAPLISREGSEWARAREKARSGPRVLIAPGHGGFHLGSLVESALGVGLTLRGAAVDFFLCDSALPGCQLTEIGTVAPAVLRSTPPQPRCAKCEKRGNVLFAPLELPIHWLGRLLTEAKKSLAATLAREVPFAAIRDFHHDGVAVGEHAHAGALRYFARGDFEGEPDAEDVVRAYLRSALLTTFAVEELLSRERYDVACFNHGIYVPQGLLTEVCRRQGLRVVTWNPAYRKSSFIFSHDDSYHHTMISEPTTAWESLEWSETLDRDTMAYLWSRRTGTNDWIWFHHEPQEDAAKIAREVGCSFSKPTVALLTNVLWDAQLHYRSNAFPNMLEWVLETIRYFAERPKLDLVIRIHPAEIRGGIPSRQLLSVEIQRAFPALPANVFVVGPESEVSTYGLTEQCNAAIIYNTKTGIEVASLGIPVIVAGEAWIRGKGFSLDASSADEYRRILDTLPFREKLSPEKLHRARKYAYHFFFRRMIPIPFVGQGEKGGKFALRCQSLADLRPGPSRGLDVICDGILTGRPFIYPAERKD